MVFYPPSWVPQLPFAPPDSIPIFEFLSNEKYGRQPLKESRNPFTCGLTGRTYPYPVVRNRVESIAKALGKRLAWGPTEGTPLEKVVCIFSLNTIDYVPVAHAVHRLSGVITTANAVFSAAELTQQLKASEAKVLVTCQPLLETALKSAAAANIPAERVFILNMPNQTPNASFRTVDDLVSEGARLPELAPLKWTKGQGARQIAFLCYSSGTSGLPKGVMISHFNVIANILQLTVHESVGREKHGVETQVELGLLPFSHIYGLVFITHISMYRGDEVIVLPKFEFETFMESIQRFKIEQLMLVPPIIVQLTRNREKVLRYDLSSVRCVYSAAAPLARETADQLLDIFPRWHITQGYGMTETSPVVSTSGENDMFVGSAGCLIPGTKAKIIDVNGREVTELDKPGELLVQSPAVTLGYLNNERATEETFIHDEDGRWIRTGDEVCVRKSRLGHEHLVVLDRIKELIKVKGHQVAPAELEAHLLTHPAVSDCAVIQVPDDHSGELPKAFIVKAVSLRTKSDTEVAADIDKYVRDHKAHYKWLKGGIEFIDSVPKSPSGKILRRVLRDKERLNRAPSRAKL